MERISVQKEIEIRKTNSKKLIEAVKEYPGIWNSGCPEYKVNKHKRDAWNRIAAKIVDDWEGYNRVEKHYTLRFLVRRWNNIRDYFNKSLKADRLARLRGEPCNRKYALADAMQFMRPELEKKISKRGLETSREPKTEADYQQTVGSIRDFETSREPKIEAEEKEEVLENNIEEDFVMYVDNFGHGFNADQTRDQYEVSPDQTRDDWSHASGPKEDTDLMFLKSLLPDMKKLADDEKFEFKYAVMKAYMDIINKRK